MQNPSVNNTGSVHYCGQNKIVRIVETLHQGLFRVKTGLSYAIAATGVLARMTTITICALIDLAIFAHFQPVAKTLEEYLGHSSLAIMHLTTFIFLPLGVFKGAFKASQLLDAIAPAVHRKILIVGTCAIHLLAALLVVESVYNQFFHFFLSHCVASPLLLPKSISILGTLILLNLGAKHMVDLIYQKEEKAQEAVRKI